MKLVFILFLTIGFTVNAVQEQILFSPQFQAQSPGIFASEKSIHLLPETSTPLPFFPVKNNNKLQFPYLPNEMKDQVIFSTPFPYFMSSTMLTPKDDDEDDDSDEKQPSPIPLFLRNKVNPYLRNKINFTQSNQGNHKREKIERASVSQQMNIHQPIDRVDMKLFNQYTTNNGPTTPHTVYRPTARSMIIAETQSDQFKPGNYQNYQNMQLPKIFVTPTTETAIPILRLSNEMDLDGSFSYEALGADQTHYVQHSRTENFGEEDQEQVVEGSYSYVGDNGQTYTVNYTADANGFRASGDHLPVAPPIPEIIQRSIQYNLAKEASMSPEEKYYNEKKSEAIGNDNRHLFAHSTQNLFTGRTPQSFSFDFPGHNVHSNSITSASTQAPVTANMGFIQDYMREKSSATISPQITFLASQGAHTPSLNTVEQTAPRLNSADKPNMLQLINYEAPSKENDQEENKGLWRWQYGLNTETNTIPEKNTISRSSGEDDDIMINFNKMTPDQYAAMIRPQVQVNQENLNNAKHAMYEAINKNQYPSMNEHYNSIPVSNEKQQVSSTETVITSSSFNNWNKKSEFNNIKTNQKVNDRVNPVQSEASALTIKPKIITQLDYVPPAQIVTQSYDYDNTFYEPKRVRTYTDVTSISEINKLMPNNNDITYYDFLVPKRGTETISFSTTQEPHIVTSEETPFMLKNMITSQNNNGFTPILNVHADYAYEKRTNDPSTTEIIEHNMFKENIFLRNLFSNHNTEIENKIRFKEEDKNYYHTKTDKEIKNNKTPKFLPLQAPSVHKMKSITNKPVDIADVLNFISSKNQFESSKIRPNFRPSIINIEDRDDRHMPLDQLQYDEESKHVPDHNINEYRNHERQEGTRGLLKNYKILQRNNNGFTLEQDTNKMKRVLTPPQRPNLPPLGRAGPSTKSYLPPTQP